MKMARTVGWLMCSLLVACGGGDDDGMTPMNDAESREFLSSGCRTGKLAIVRKDGRPHVTPIWFIYEDDAIYFTPRDKSEWCACLRRDPRVELLRDSDVPFVLFGRVADPAGCAWFAPTRLCTRSFSVRPPN